MANEIITEIRLELDQLKKDLKKSQKTAEKTGKDTGKKMGDNIESGLRSGFGRLSGAFAALGATIVSAFTLKESIAAATRQQDALNALNTQLALTGDFSIAASEDMQRFASDLQSVSTIGDETTLQMLALAKTFGRTNEETQKLVKAAVELSAATGLTLEGSVKNLGKTYSGLTGELGESLPIIKTLTAEQLKAGEGIDLLLNRFSGSALAKINTFSGAIDQTSNLFGDMLESIGEIVIESPLLIKVVNSLGIAFKSAGDAISNFASGRDLIGEMTLGVIEFGGALVTYVVAPLELVFNLGQIVFNSITTGLQAIVAGSLALGEVVLPILDRLRGGAGEVSDAYRNLAQSSVDTLNTLAAGTRASMDKVFDFDVSLTSEQYLLRLQEFVETVKPQVRNDFASIAASANAAMEPELESGWTFVEKGFENSFSKVALTSEKFAKGLQQRLDAAFASVREGIANSFASIGAALVQGENAFAAFGKAILGVFGDLAIQLGTFYFLLGLANLFLNPAAAAAEIAGGLALIVLGGALKALASGGGGAGVGGGAPAAATGGEPSGGGVIANGGDGFSPSENTAQAFEEDQRVEPGTNVTVNIEGNVLDRRETGLEIVQIINETFDSNGTTIATAGA